MRFFTEPRPVYGRAEPLTAHVHRIVAPNPGPLTCHGTNTYVLRTGEGVLVVDPGPDHAAHRCAVLDHLDGRLDAIVLTHRHADHAGGAPSLARTTGAPIAAAAGTPDALGVDRVVGEGDRICGAVVLPTPGHARDHLCLAGSDGTLFTGDHLMAWAPTAVADPDGDAALYLAGLERLRSRSETLFLPGHGPPLLRPRRLIDMVIRMRREREALILAAIETGPSRHTDALVAALHPRTRPPARLAIMRQLTPYLRKLEAEGAIVRGHDGWHTLRPN